MKNKIICILIMPLLYIRYALVVFFTISIIANSEKLFIIGLLYALIFGFIMGNLEGMELWVYIFKKILKVKYRVKNYRSLIMHSHCVWSHPTLIIKNKEYEISVATSGGNLYEASANICRKAIVYYLWN